jgi:hypothetical protein
MHEEGFYGKKAGIYCEHPCTFIVIFAVLCSALAGQAPSAEALAQADVTEQRLAQVNSAHKILNLVCYDQNW